MSVVIIEVPENETHPLTWFYYKVYIIYLPGQHINAC